MSLFSRWTRSACADNTSLEAGEISVLVVRMSSQVTIVVAGRVTVNSAPHLRSVLLRLLQREADEVR